MAAVGQRLTCWMPLPLSSAAHILILWQALVVVVLDADLQLDLLEEVALLGLGRVLERLGYVGTH